MIFQTFFMYFGIFAFIGAIVLTILVNKELKKQLPTAEERKEMENFNILQSGKKYKKSELRSLTAKYRYQKQLDDYVAQVLSVDKIPSKEENPVFVEPK